MKKKKIKWIGGLLALCLMAEPGAAMAKAESEVQETEMDKETEIHPGERTATIVVVSITGNELTYYEVEDETETEEASEETEQNETSLETENGSEKSEISEKSDKGAKSEEKNTQTSDTEAGVAEDKDTQKDESMTLPDGIQQGDGMPQGDNDIEPPDGMSQGDGSMAPPDGRPQGDSSMTPPDGVSQGESDASGMPENMPSGDFQKGGRSAQQNTKTVYLPVPVVVHTDADEKRTFSILETGDRLQVTIVTDEEGNETITEIWMLKE